VIPKIKQIWRREASLQRAQTSEAREHFWFGSLGLCNQNQAPGLKCQPNIWNPGVRPVFQDSGPSCTRHNFLLHLSHRNGPLGTAKDFRYMV